MPSKRVDPIERALDAYFELDTEQKQVFDTIMRIAKKADRVYGSRPAEAEAPTRGRPKGSKNKKTGPVNPLAPETFDAAELFAQNGSVTEDI